MAVYKYDPEFERQSRGGAASFGPGTTTSQVQQKTDAAASLAKSEQQRADQLLKGVNIPTLADLFGGMGLLGGGASAGKGPNASDVLASRKYQDELAKERRTIDAYRNMLSGGGYRAGNDRMLEMIGQQGATSRGNVESEYARALADIAAGYGQAQEMTGRGYSALEEFLNQNPNNPYAGMRAQAGPAPDAMEQILSAYGVSADPVRAQVSAEQAAAQQGAAGFQNLLDTLGASALQSDRSRLAEMQMAQMLANQSLSGQQAGYQSQASRAQADALAQIQARMMEAQMQQEGAAEQRRQEIENAIAAAGGRMPTIPGGGDSSGGGASRAIDQLAAKADTVKDKKLAAKIQAFVEANPNAGIKKIQQQFPALAKNLK
jgi:hypothetical protein